MPEGCQGRAESLGPADRVSLVATLLACDREDVSRCRTATPDLRATESCINSADILAFFARFMRWQAMGQLT
jgi:hypothetical protein